MNRCTPLILLLICALHVASKSVERLNACFAILLPPKLSEVNELRRAIEQLESKFNKGRGYPYVIFIEGAFSEEWKTSLRQETASEVDFVPISFDIPSFVDPDRIPTVVSAYARNFTVGYRHMCRFYGGQLAVHPAMQKYDYYWRIDADAEYLCDIQYDPFKYMSEQNIKYGYVMEYFEIEPILAGELFDVTLRFADEQGIDRTKLMGDMNLYGDYNRCHYWNNFEVVDLRFLRSKVYLDYFNYVDRAGGIYYERWGDALIRSLGAHLALRSSEIRMLPKIAYRHGDTCNTIWCKPELKCSEYFKSGVFPKCEFPDRLFHGSTEETAINYWRRRVLMITLLVTGTFGWFCVVRPMLAKRQARRAVNTKSV